MLLYHCRNQLNTSPQSPDLNVIENLWFHLERAVQKHQITSKEQLKSVLQEEWLNIAPETTRHLVELMPRRLEAVISAKDSNDYFRLTYPFKCLQFPIRLAFAKTINKSQGQTMTKCGLDLESPCFSQGQLYVACPSRQVIYSQFGLAIHQNDHQARRRFVEWAQNEIAAVPDFHKRILFSDEAHFWLNGYVNKQNCRIWSETNPQVYVETPLHPEKLTVWCALWAGGILLQKR
ncbi:putative DD41D transposase [Trichonephila clavipes]|nr:putative DD41D transposase [Trichonephila clavipes]